MSFFVFRFSVCKPDSLRKKVLFGGFWGNFNFLENISAKCTIVVAFYYISMVHFAEIFPKKLKLPQNPLKSSFKRGEFGLHTEKSQKKNKFFSRL